MSPEISLRIPLNFHLFRIYEIFLMTALKILETPIQFLIVQYFFRNSFRFLQMFLHKFIDDFHKPPDVLFPTS